MSSGFSRIDRIAELIQRELSQFVQREVKEPTLPGLITITHVKVSKDLSLARVYFSVINQDPEATVVFLNSKRANFRTLLAKSMRTRTVPELHFYFDESLEYSLKLSRLIDKANPEQ